VSEYARKLIGVDALDGGGSQWTGAGEVVGIVDSGIDSEHPDFTDRVADLGAVEGASEVDHAGHGTHVAGIAGGGGEASNGKIRGMAPEAKLAVLGIVDAAGKLKLPADVGELLHRVADMGAKIINLSWGRALSSTYENGAMAVDSFVRERPEILVVVAAGNEGSAPADYPSLYSVGTPATAKNAITVGACCSIRPDFAAETWGTYKPQKFPGPPTKDLPLAGNGDLPAALSSRGPSDSESVSPDLLAPGSAILAPRAQAAAETAFWRPCADHGGRYAFMNGTSMAAPVVTGAAAVVRQYLRAQRPGAEPSAALLKAVLIASAQRLPWARAADDEADFGYPDFDQGYGRLNLATVLPSAGAPPGRRLELVDVPNDSDEALESRAPPGATHRAVRGYRFTLSAGATDPLRVVLCWSDYSVAGIQNNLNLQLQCADARRIVGNPEHRWLVPKVKYLDPRLQGVILDRRNNVQRIDVADPPAGPYRVRLLAENTLFPPQGYALCVCGELDGGLEAEEQ
jgi:subtilisin family serine protease